MPELPDVAVYIEAIEARVRGPELLAVRLTSPFVLRRSVDPPLRADIGRFSHEVLPRLREQARSG